MKKLDFTILTEDIVSKTILKNGYTEVSLTSDGVRFDAKCETSDPGVRWDVKTMFSMMGLDNVPFRAEDISGVVIKVKANAINNFELFYACGDVHQPTPYYSRSSYYFGKKSWEYMVLDFSQPNSNFKGDINDFFRIDYSALCQAGDYIVINEISIFDSIDDARSYAEKNNSSELPPVPDITFKSVPDRVADGYYVCLHEENLASPSDNILQRFDNLEDAKKLCFEKRVYGYRVADGKGKIVYAPFEYIQCDMLRECKWVTDYVREHGFTYGDAPINPGVNHDAKKVSCDRLVCWALYRLGFFRMPVVSGVVVSWFPDWCGEMGFERTNNADELQPGDVMLVRPHPTEGYPQHAFCYAMAGDEIGKSYRYDCGSDLRIQSVQPSYEPVFTDIYSLQSAWHIRVTKENNVFADYLLNR